MTKTQDMGTVASKVLRLLQGKAAAVDTPEICTQMGLTEASALSVMRRLMRDRLVTPCGTDAYELTPAGEAWPRTIRSQNAVQPPQFSNMNTKYCLLYTSDAADE